ncbi:hypothetical protein ABZS86_25460 [Streptomyces sp. NPDC005355]|uniref:hypothetical protein n=1 Tax=Streptomyces sp. NPDC005355 TaxID=3157038 RepID=UPI0033BD745F
MTTTRRPLGTGPNTTASAPAGVSDGRRLAAERADAHPLLATPEPNPADPTEAPPIRSRRRLGDGTATLRPV